MLRRILKYAAFALLTAAVVAAGYVVYWAYFPSIPRMRADRIASVEVEIIEWKTQKAAKITSNDASRIGEFLKVLATAQRTSDHKCGDVARVHFRGRSGEQVSIGILPGHDPNYYEYRYDGRINRVNRAPFLEALSGIGVNDILLDP